MWNKFPLCNFSSNVDEVIEVLTHDTIHATKYANMLTMFIVPCLFFFH